MKWLANFRLYCHEHDVNLLPDDMRYLESILKKISPIDRRQIAMNYYSTWIKGITDSPYPSIAQNNGRRRANEYLGKVLRTK
jgi:hypothetical protein